MCLRVRFFEPPLEVRQVFDEGWYESDIGVSFPAEHAADNMVKTLVARVQLL